MIPAKKIYLFDKGFELYLKPLLNKSFSGLLGRGMQQPSSHPVIFIANHSSWWDGLLFFFLNRMVWKHDIHMMMDEKGLLQYKFFRYLGAFSINRAKPKDILASLQYAEKLLKSGKSVVLFPQGDEFHQEKRPLGFSPGITFLMERCSGIPVVPLSFYYSFRHVQKPEVWIMQGSPFQLENLSGKGRKEQTIEIEQLVTHQLEALKSFVVAEDTAAFEDLLKRGK